MCTNYTPSTRASLATSFGVAPPPEAWSEEAWKSSCAPVLRWDAAQDARAAALGGFGLIPAWARDEAEARRIRAGTLNARSETAAAKPAFREAWRRGQRALVPMQRFFEPDWRSGTAVRTAIHRADGADFAVAALWSLWRAPDAPAPTLSFTLLTVNADGHPLMGLLHRPEEEKRSLVVVPPAAWDVWLRGGDGPARGLLQLFPAGQMTLDAAPLPPRARRPAASRSPVPAATNLAFDF